MFAMSFHLLIFFSLVVYFSSTKYTDANPRVIVNIFWSLGWDNIHFFQSVNCRQKRVGRGMDLPCTAATLHYWTCFQSLGILGYPFSDRALFYFCFLLLINKLQIKLWKLHVSPRPLVSLDASDSEALETSIRTVLTFKNRTIVLISKKSKLMFESRSMNKATASETSLQMILKNTSGGSGMGEDEAEDTRG